MSVLPSIQVRAAHAGLQRHLRVLTLSSLFPSDARPRHGIFVETRLKQLMKDHPVDARVIAPVPWFPFSSAAFGAYAKFAATPRHAARASGLQVSYPRYAMLPKIGIAFQPDAQARAALAQVHAWARVGWQPEIIDAHYLYPDGVAAAILASRLKVPFVMTARGTDVNVIARLPAPGRKIIEAARQAATVIAVSTPLKAILVSLGVEAAKIVVLRNGVDLEVFGVEDRLAARKRLNLPLEGRLLASVGNLVPEKGLALAIEVAAAIKGCRLVIVGEGPLRAELGALAARLGVTDRVVFLPAMAQADLRHLYSSADALLLTSTREGWPNVVLEALACGTPVIAADVGAVREILTDDKVGQILTSRDVSSWIEATSHVLSASVPREQIHQHAAQFDWAAVSQGQWDILLRACLPASRHRPVGD